ncbi:MAG TPA: DegV family protein [Candidatus Dormibacteraeota bacterium]|nr:DegV family protein [Candidatus Dormibacteraeota bacterium]
MSVAIVTDSTSDLDPAVARELGVTVVPLFVNFGEQRYLDGVVMTHDEFYARMGAGGALPTTSQPTAQAFEDAYRPLAEAGEDVISVHISAKLSGTINAASAGARAFPRTRIECFDSQTATAGLGLLAIEAARMARAGAGTDEILAKLHALRSSQRGYAVFPDLQHLVRGGRIGKAKALVGGILRIVPILEVKDGEAHEYGKARTFGRGLDEVADAAVRHLVRPDQAHLAIVHTHAPEAAADLLLRVRARLQAEPREVTTVAAGPSIGVHGGPGAAGVFLIG